MDQLLSKKSMDSYCHLQRDFGIIVLFYIKNMFLFFKMYPIIMINAVKIKEEFLYSMDRDGKLLID